MNVKTAASMGILLLGTGLFGLTPANARTPKLNSPTYQVSISPPSSNTIAQAYSEASSPLYGTWKLTYSVNGVVYESILVMNGYTGGLGTTYYDASIRKTRVISQYIQLKSSSQGLILIGSNPTDYYTKKPARDYAADSFLLSIRPNGSFVAVTCDRASQCSNVDMQVIK